MYSIWKYIQNKIVTAKMTRPFLAIVPQPVKSGDKIRLKGKIKSGGFEYSINFANELCPYPGNVFYHFKVIIPEKLIIENHKKNDEWMEEHVKDWESSDGSEFAFEFIFKEEGVYVYLFDEDSRNYISYYENQHNDFSEIQTVQVWGDVEIVNELTFQYS